MTGRMHTELQRLYGVRAAQDPGNAPEAAVWRTSDGQTRALVLGLARPASWAELSRVWQGVQADLELPAPAIAVSGSDGFQLWFALAEPLRAVEATDFLDLLRRRYLADVATERVALQPADAVLPPAAVGPRRWSAFVAQDLASLFADEPWLDLPPGDDAQAELLARLRCTTPDALQRALERLRPAAVQAASPAVSLDPRRFLQDVMNDRSVDLRLRIEAAKALLPGAPASRALPD